MVVALLALASAASGFAGHSWVQHLVSHRERLPLTKKQSRWTSAGVITVGSAGAGLLWLIDAPVALRIGLILSGIIAWYLVCIDMALHKLPDPLVAAHGGAVGAGLLTAYVFDQLEGQILLHAIVGGGAGFLIFLALALIGRRSLGFGDVKLAGMLGMMTGVFGPVAFGQWLVLSFLLGGAFAVLMVATRRMSAKDSIAFGPWLIIGSYIAVALNAVGQL